MMHIAVVIGYPAEQGQLFQVECSSMRVVGMNNNLNQPTNTKTKLPIANT